MAASNILLAANQPQGMGQAANASQMLGLGAPGGELQQQLKQQIADRRADLLAFKPGQYGASTALFGTAR